MNIQLTPCFERSFAKLIRAEMQAVRKALALLTEDPKHPGLHVKKMEGRNIWEARASKALRMTFAMSGEALLMRNVGKHDKVLRKP